MHRQPQQSALEPARSPLSILVQQQPDEEQSHVKADILSDVVSIHGGRPAKATDEDQIHGKEATLVWKDLTVTVRNKESSRKGILQGTSGIVLPRQMLAIMGPSGCGKSTLLDSLAGRLKPGVDLTGDVYINGRIEKLSYGKAGYVEQQEALYGCLTVYETVKFAAHLRLRGTAAESQVVVDHVLEELGLWDVRNTMIGTWFVSGVSGGQRRRVAIACELVAQPTLIFLDEPTSGLDAASSYHIMRFIRQLCLNGRTIVTVIHQPASEVYELFDQLALMANGKQIYFGNSQQAGGLFTAAGLPLPPNRSLTDHLLHCINRDFDAATVDANVERIQEEYLSSPQHQAVSRAIAGSLARVGPAYMPPVDAVPELKRISVLVSRFMLTIFRNPGLFWLRAVIYLAVALALGTMYINSSTQYIDVLTRAYELFFALCFLSFQVIVAFPSLSEDLEIFAKERLAGYYKVGSFVVASTISTAPFNLITALLCSLPLLYIPGLNLLGDRTVYCALVFFLVFEVVEGLALALCAIMPHWMLALITAAGYMGIFFLPAGMLKRLDILPKAVWRYPLSYMSMYTWSFQGLMHNEFDGTDNWGCPPPNLDKKDCTMTGKQVLEDALGVYSFNKWWMLLILVVMALLYRMVFWMGCVFKEQVAKGNIRMPRLNGWM